MWGRGRCGERPALSNAGAMGGRRPVPGLQRVPHQTEEMRERLSETMTALLKEPPPEEWSYQMSAVENLREENGFRVGLPNKTSQKAFSQDLFLSAASRRSWRSRCGQTSGWRPPIARRPWCGGCYRATAIWIRCIDAVPVPPRKMRGWRHNYLLTAGRSIRPDCLPVSAVI